MVTEERESELRFRGIAVAPGIAHGPAVIRLEENNEIVLRKISEDAVSGEISRLEAALAATRRELLEMQTRIADSIGTADASIFDAHLLIVEDPTLLDEVVRSIQSQRHNVEFAFHEVAARYGKFLRETNDPYLRERVDDIEDVTRRILRHLLGRPSAPNPVKCGKHILITRNLAPSETALLDRESVLGFVTELGGKTSHSAIMARSLGIPSISGLQDITSLVTDGSSLILDGYQGVLIANPKPPTLAEYASYQKKRELISVSLESLRDRRAITSDGHHIVLSANIKTSSEMEEVVESGAEGVGLFRTEFLFLGRETLPNEEEQYGHYCNVAKKALPHSVIIRTLDVGGDKIAESMNLPRENYPFLGLRAIRLCLERPAIFKPQLRAILRAAVIGNVRVMYPMISNIAEFRQATAVLEECKAELRKENKPFNAEIEAGAMIEVPSAAMTADLLAKEVKFFSVGTNDLIQYAIAIDRMDDRIAHLYEPTHPAILRLIQLVVDASRANGIWTGICGEAASDLILVPLFLGLGITELSVSPALVPQVKKAIQSVSFSDCQALAEQAHRATLACEILELCLEFARRSFPDLL